MPVSSAQHTTLTQFLSTMYLQAFRYRRHCSGTLVQQLLIALCTTRRLADVIAFCIGQILLG